MDTLTLHVRPTRLPLLRETALKPAKAVDAAGKAAVAGKKNEEPGERGATVTTERDGWTLVMLWRGDVIAAWGESAVDVA